jgi:hypothetical protein
MQAETDSDPHARIPPVTGEAPLGISRRLVATGMVVCLCVAAALLAKQAAGAKIATRDACAYYLPLARLFAEQGLEASQHPIIPPLYSTAMGTVAPLLGFADDPFELAGRLISAVCVLCTIVCVYGLGRTLAHPRVGLAAASLCAVNYWMLRFGANVGPEAMYALLLTAMVVLLIRYARKPTVLRAAAVGAAAALAGLTRSEGILMAPLAVLAMAAMAPRKPSGAGLRAGLHVVVLLAIVAVVWWPRMAWMQQTTGQFVPDIRVLQFVGDRQVSVEHPEWWRPPHQINDTIATAPNSRSLAERATEAFDALAMVITPWAWALAGAWLLLWRRMPGRLDGRLILAAVIVVELVSVAPVKMDRRYVFTIAGMSQVWAGLGLVALMERFRSSPGAFGRLSRSVPRQVAVMWGLMAVLTALPIFSSNVGIRHQELRGLGERILLDAGPGKVVASATSEPPYYARGRAVVLVDPEDGGPDLTRDELRDICRSYSIDFFVLRSRETWSTWLLENAEAGTLPPGALVAEADNESTRSWKEDVVRSYLVDARKLFSGDAEH